ncbi:MAG TPA: acetate--CoA ligase family protein, partial [Burkholderiaceae bacterium]|nr:acetate--CoA ligase family protein [Burkholderiaceae bacterium]
MIAIFMAPLTRVVRLARRPAMPARLRFDCARILCSSDRRLRLQRAFRFRKLDRSQAPPAQRPRRILALGLHRNGSISRSNEAIAKRRRTMAYDKAAVRQILDRVRADKRTALTAPEGKLVCDAYGIPVPQEGVATSAADASALAQKMGFPVVLKIVSPDILHKTEAGGVLVGLKSAEEVAKGYDTILNNAKKYKADAQIVGVQVQQMLAGGQEVIVGAVTDGSFGKLVAFGLGGVLVEVLKDITFRLAPATTSDALSML